MQNAAKAKLDNARPNNKDSPNALRQQELKTELTKIRQTQQGQKSSRTAILDKVKRLDEQLKGRHRAVGRRGRLELQDRRRH